MKILLILALLSPKKYVQQLLPIVEPIAVCEGVDEVWLLAHSAIETGYDPCPKGNNFFGIKALKGEPYFLAKTVEYLRKPKGLILSRHGKLYKCQVWEKFRSYEKPEDSFLHYISLLKSKTVILEPRELTTCFCGTNYMTSPNCNKTFRKVIVIIESALYQIKCNQE